MRVSSFICVLMLCIMPLAGCIKSATVCPKQQPVSYPTYDRQLNAAVRDVVVAFAPEEERVGNKLLLRYKITGDYYKTLDHSPAFRGLWEDLTLRALKKGKAFNPKSKNNLILDVKVTELYAPDYIQKLLYREPYYTAHVSALYTLKRAHDDTVVWKKNYHAESSYDGYKTKGFWGCAPDPNSKTALRQAIIEINDIFIRDLLKNEEKIASAGIREVVGGFNAGSPEVKVFLSKKLSKMTYRTIQWKDTSPGFVVAACETALKQALSKEKVYNYSSDRKHVIYAEIVDIWHEQSTIWDDAFARLGIEYTVVSGTGKKRKTVFRKTIAKKATGDWGAFGGPLSTYKKAIAESAREFASGLKDVAEGNPNL